MKKGDLIAKIGVFTPTDDLPAKVMVQMSSRIREILTSLDNCEIYGGLEETFIKEARGAFRGLWNGAELFAEVILGKKGEVKQVISVLDSDGNKVDHNIFNFIELHDEVFTM